MSIFTHHTAEARAAPPAPHEEPGEVAGAAAREEPGEVAGAAAREDPGEAAGAAAREDPGEAAAREDPGEAATAPLPHTAASAAPDAAADFADACPVSLDACDQSLVGSKGTGGNQGFAIVHCGVVIDASKLGATSLSLAHKFVAENAKSGEQRCVYVLRDDAEGGTGKTRWVTYRYSEHGVVRTAGMYLGGRDIRAWVPAGNRYTIPGSDKKVCYASDAEYKPRERRKPAAAAAAAAKTKNVVFRTHNSDDDDDDDDSDATVDLGNSDSAADDDNTDHDGGGAVCAHKIAGVSVAAAPFGRAAAPLVRRGHAGAREEAQRPAPPAAALPDHPYTRIDTADAVDAEIAKMEQQLDLLRRRSAEIAGRKRAEGRLAHLAERVADERNAYDTAMHALAASALHGTHEAECHLAEAASAAPRVSPLRDANGFVALVDAFVKAGAPDDDAFAAGVAKRAHDAVHAMSKGVRTTGKIDDEIEQNKKNAQKRMGDILDDIKKEEKNVKGALVENTRKRVRGELRHIGAHASSIHEQQAEAETHMKRARTDATRDAKTVAGRVAASLAKLRAAIAPPPKDDTPAPEPARDDAAAAPRAYQWNMDIVPGRSDAQDVNETVCAIMTNIHADMHDIQPPSLDKFFNDAHALGTFVDDTAPETARRSDAILCMNAAYAIVRTVVAGKLEKEGVITTERLFDILGQ